MSALRIGWVGCGTHANEMLLPQLMRHDVALAGLCDTDPERLSRTACVAGAAFLLLLYFTVAPFPWLPEPTRVEGHYYFVNKNLVEMLALLTLATTQSGRWVGLDGLVRYLNPLRWRRTH